MASVKEDSKNGSLDKRKRNSPSPKTQAPIEDAQIEKNGKNANSSNDEQDKKKLKKL